MTPQNWYEIGIADKDGDTETVWYREKTTAAIKIFHYLIRNKTLGWPDVTRAFVDEWGLDPADGIPVPVRTVVRCFFPNKKERIR
jgi:hypothetical protein